MAVTLRGNPGTSLVTLPGYPRLERGNDGLWIVRYRYWCAMASASGLVPAHDAACPLSGHEDLVCKSVTIEPHETPTMAYVEVEYRDPGSTPVNIVADTATVVRESETAFFEEPIEDAGGGMSSTDINTAIANNARTIRKATVTYSRTIYKSSFSWTENNIIKADGANTVVGNLMPPTGLTSPTAGKWLFTGKTVREAQNDLVEVRESWTYDENGWNTLRPNAYDTGAATTTTTTTT